MPTSTTAKLPKPKSDNEFEYIANDFLCTYFKKSFTLYGRKGQSQEGLDAYCKDKNSYILAQYKNYTDHKTCLQKIKQDIKKMHSQETLTPFDTIYIVTSLDRDTRMQNAINNYEDTEIFFWDDIEKTLLDSKKLMKKYYSEFLVSDSFSSTDSELHDIKKIINKIEKVKEILTSFEKNDTHWYDYRYADSILNKCEKIYNTLKEINDIYLENIADWNKLTIAAHIKTICEIVDDKEFQFESYSFENDGILLSNYKDWVFNKHISVTITTLLIDLQTLQRKKLVIPKIAF
ncbi:hypothetical protein [Chakrabartyella piscis]|uniref:hypothetical protein n=1 Tax=Chakrabartyella piscis TaxID=2918914 RepID=UPI002958658C|nr:hypothetical protein [Chakrabartyella piscis]